MSKLSRIFSKHILNKAHNKPQRLKKQKKKTSKTSEHHQNPSIVNRRHSEKIEPIYTYHLVGGLEDFYVSIYWE